MPLPNRVDPYGALHAVAERGLFFGNRGVLHDRSGRLRRERSAERRWICCVLEWKGRRRELLRPGRYTELFFLDEATALAAGHRPCAECRRADHLRFRSCVAAGQAGADVGSAVALDRLLDPQRGACRPLVGEWRDLPEGTIVDDGSSPYLVAAGSLFAWGHGGYRAAALARPTRVVTPAAAVAALEGGYRPMLHPSART
jgi:hypothetical protein